MNLSSSRVVHSMVLKAQVMQADSALLVQPGTKSAA